LYQVLRALAVIFRQRWEGFQILAKNSEARSLAIKVWKDDQDQAPQPAVALGLWTEGRPIISPGSGGIHQSIRRLRPRPWPRLAFAAIADRAFVSPRNRACQGSSSSREG